MLKSVTITENNPRLCDVIYERSLNLFKNIFCIETIFRCRTHRSRNHIRLTIVEHCSGRCTGFWHPESGLPDSRFKNAFLFRPVTEPCPEPASRIFGAILSTEIGRVDPQNGMDNIRVARPIRDSVFDASDRLIILDCRNDVLVDAFVIVELSNTVFFHLRHQNSTYWS